MERDSAHPSQAEGEDTANPDTGTDEATGHPSQAEGEDPDPGSEG